MKPWLCVDFDHTIRDNGSPNDGPMPGAREALSTLRERGYRIMIHSCNGPEFIQKWMNNHDIRYDGIWGDSPGDRGKPVGLAYIDDRAIRFTTWDQTMKELDNALS